MDKKNIDYSLYFITDRNIMSAKSVDEAVLLAIEGGAGIVQLREKNISDREFYETALRIKEITKKSGVPLIINDRADIAAAADCSGVHIGREDMPVEAVRKIIGHDKIIGVSARTAADAAKAEEDGADYIGAGAVFLTATKSDAKPISIKELSEIKKRVNIPVVAIGGINEENVLKLKGSGIDGAAVVSAIIAKSDIKGAAKEMKRKIKIALAGGFYD